MWSILHAKKAYRQPYPQKSWAEKEEEEEDDDDDDDDGSDERSSIL